MKGIAAILLGTMLSLATQAQKRTEEIIKRSVDSINTLLDQSVVDKKLEVLRKHYGDDFVFTHATGLIDSKGSWIKGVADTKDPYISRTHDSVVVELHGDIAILMGRLTVRRQRPDKVEAYALRYVRVFAKRKNVWQMISHKSTHEWHLE